MTTSKVNEPREPKISTNADFANGATKVVAGTQVNDRVSYEGLVPGKEYTLKAELISKADGKSVLGEGEKTFTPEASKGEVVVEITVFDKVTEPVKAAVAFEKLFSKQVNENGQDAPNEEGDGNLITTHEDINDDNQTVPKPEKPSDTPNGSHGKGDGNNGSSKSDWPWWLLLIPGLGIVKIIADGFGGGHDGGHNVSDGGHEGGNDHGDVTEDNGRDNNVKDETVENGGRGDRDDSALDATAPEDAGQPLPSNAERVEIKHVPSGATKLEPGMQSYIK